MSREQTFDTKNYHLETREHSEIRTDHWIAPLGKQNGCAFCKKNCTGKIRKMYQPL